MEELRYQVDWVSPSEAIVFDTKHNVQICYIADGDIEVDGEEASTDDAAIRAQAIADALNNTGYDYQPVLIW